MLQEPETLYKLMTLYMLDKVNFPLTNAQLSDFFLNKDYTTYFTLQSVLNDLVESNLISSVRMANAAHYEITDDGREALGFFVSDISDAAVSDMNSYLEKNKFSLRSETSITSEYYKSDNEDFNVHLTARENKSTILSIDILVPDEKAAKLMCDNWKTRSQKLYSHIMHTLIDSGSE